ncbi:uncharacterized protein BO97DRAFT_368546 [Aspergillus homomorphus CBS 101889]|uniref:SUZ-C domain-containing protein n=1 Tax=Aspergillus homomorphus (strain CBS 101889) TaxID=1450537 RepID=A0A395HYG1_ASPHC|nr:hypothetical protein BO97DRAFT_368546 [Aspergillus homomorphus CBS 101889]RAL12485.1 hypothetical protein BO97DRAFT_368546 [Aspergillus homomorphus CBS 101889]
MSAKSSTGPDAWAENWEEQADKVTSDTPPPPAEKKVSSKVTKAQRRAQQAEFNRQLWAEAESPQTFHFLESRSDVPLRQEFKPAVTVLSRNPQIATRGSGLDGTTAGMSRLGVNDDDSDEEGGRAALPTAEERQAMALRNLEDRQRKYEEVRERLFGSPSAPTSGASSPRSATPPTKPYEGRGKGRGGRGNGRENRDNTNRDNSANSSKRDSSAASGKSRQLYDPDSPRTSAGQNSRREKQSVSRPNTDGTQAPRQPIRSPRGPDSSGRGGFRGGFRGGRGG